MTFRPDLLIGKTALVTGGGTGIGRGLSLALAAHGCDVAIISRTAAHLEQTSGDIEALGRRSLAVAADVRDPAAIDEAVEEAGPLLLQDHGDLVCYRNIWVEELALVGSDTYEPK